MPICAGAAGMVVFMKLYYEVPMHFKSAVEQLDLSGLEEICDDRFEYSCSINI